MGDTIWTWLPGMAFGVFGYEYEISRRDIRHPYRRNRPYISASHERNCTERSSYWKDICKVLDALRAHDSRRTEDEQIFGKLLHCCRCCQERLQSDGNKIFVRKFALQRPA